MSVYNIYYNKCYAHTANMIKKTVRGKGLYVNPVRKQILINNTIIPNYDDINSIEFIVDGYKHCIEINPNKPLLSTDIQQPAYKA